MNLIKFGTPTHFCVLSFHKVGHKVRDILLKQRKQTFCLRTEEYKRKFRMYIFFLIYIFYWSIVDLQCFRCTAGDSVISSVQLLNHVRLFVTPWTAACQASLSITNSQSLPKLIATESAMPSNHLILCCPLLLLPSIFPASGSFPWCCLYQMAKVLEFKFQHQSFQWIFRTGLL